MLINRALLLLLKGSGGILSARCAAETVLSLLAVARAYIVALIISGVMGNGLTNSSFVPQILLFCALLGTEAVMTWVNTWLVVKCGTKIKSRLRMQLLDKVLHLGPSYVSEHRSGDICSTLVGRIEALDPYYSSYIPALVSTIVTSLVIISYLLTIDLYVALVCFLGIVIVLIVPSFWFRVMDERGKEDWRLHAEFHSDMIDNLQGMTTLKAFNASKTRGKKLEKQAWAMHRSTMRNLTVSLIESGILQFGAVAGSVISVGVGILRASNGAFPAEKMVFILFLVTSCFAPVHALINAWHLGFRGMAASPLIFKLLYAQEKVQVFRDQPAGMQHEGTDQTMRVEFDGVAFGYSQDSPAVLNDIKFDIPNGKTTALVGRSGSGKSTVINLLSGFYPVWRGDIKICGKSIGDYSETELRSLIGVVWQEPYLFYGSILDNIRMARPAATMEQVAEAAKNAQIHAFIEALPTGYETLVGERGMRLSGGEKQRIAIARCFLRDPQLIIFDEATANLDGENEAKIQESMRMLTRQKTTLIVAHRLSTIVDADKICVLDNGCITQTGTHEELIAREGIYKTLMLRQWGVMHNG